MARIQRYRKWTADNWSERWQALWRKANMEGDVFKKPGRALARVPRSRTNAEWAFGRYYEFLSNLGRWDDDTFLDCSNLRDYASYLITTVAPMTVVSQLKDLLAAVSIMYPERDLKDAWAATTRFEKMARPTRNVSERLLDPVELIRRGYQIMEKAEAERKPNSKTARRYGLGALIVAAAYCPLRLRNWQLAIIDHHIYMDTGRVVFEAGELKRKKAGLEFTLPPEVLVVLQQFVKRFRPLLLAADADDQGYVWPACNGGPLHRNTLAQAVRRLMRGRNEKRFNFHCFRHSCATFIVDVAPERARIASSVLHHARRSTTEKHYVKGRKRAAFHRYHEAVRGVIAKGRRRARRSGR